MVEMGNTYPIRVEALNAGYDRTVIVQDVCLAIPPGEILALIGPNGSGKSTVLKTISGQLERIGGEIDIYGTPVQNLSREEVARNLSMVSTERPRPEMMSCREMVATGRYPYTGRLGILSEEDERITDQAIRAVHAEEIADRDFLRISDGQRQRVMLARALCQEPDILILDEPTSFLDLQYKIDILSTLRRVAKARGISVILSMHELEFVPAAADRAACVSEHRIQRVGTPEEILTAEVMEDVFHLPEGSGGPVIRGICSYAEELKKIVRSE